MNFTSAVVDDIATRYAVLGSGPPLLMCSPGGFDARIEKWSTQSIYRSIKLLDHLPAQRTCIVFDRRETGVAGGRVERVQWRDYARHAKALLDHLGIERAAVIGACMGVSVAIAFAVDYPAATERLVLYWPVGGAHYRISAQRRFGEHLAFAQRSGLDAIVELALAGEQTFGEDPRLGPWCSVLRSDPDFASTYRAQSLDAYLTIVGAMGRSLFDRDTAPGAEPEDLMLLTQPALVVPGNDRSHATSAARYLAECLPQSTYWDVGTDGQTESAVNARLFEFLSPA